MSRPTTEDVLAFVNAHHGTGYRCVRRLAGGIQSGAYELREPGGQRVVLKWSTRAAWAEQVLRAAPVVARVRALGWPTPAWLAVGVTPDGLPYQVQEFVDGVALDRSGLDELPVLLALNARQAGLDPDPGRDWTQWTREMVLDGRDGYVERARAPGPEVSTVVDRLVAAGRPYCDAPLPRHDLVHGDLNPGNVIMAAAEVAGVIDIEALGSGSRAIDLAGRLLSSDGEAERRVLRAAMVEAAGEPGLVLFGAGAAITGFTFLQATNPAGLPTAISAAMRFLDELDQL